MDDRQALRLWANAQTDAIWLAWRESTGSTTARIAAIAQRLSLPAVLVEHVISRSVRLENEDPNVEGPSPNLAGVVARNSPRDQELPPGIHHPHHPGTGDRPPTQGTPGIARVRVMGPDGAVADATPTRGAWEVVTTQPGRHYLWIIAADSP